MEITDQGFIKINGHTVAQIKGSDDHGWVIGLHTGLTYRHARHDYCIRWMHQNLR